MAQATKREKTRASGCAPSTEAPLDGTRLGTVTAPGGEPLRVLFDDRPGFACTTGIGRYATMLGRLLDAGVAGAEAFLFSRVGGRSYSSAAEEELALPALLERERVDVFHSPVFHLPALVPARLRVAVTIHDAIPLVAPELASPEFRALFAAEAGHAATRADLVVCPSEHARSQLVGALGLEPERMFVLGETPAPTFAPAPSATVAQVCERHGLTPGRYLLSVGSLEHRKAPDLILETLALLRPRVPGLVAAFAGPAAGFDLAGEAEKHGVASHVRGLGRVSDEDLAALYTGALALLFPSRHEGFGLPIVEAFACRTPVVAANATAIPEVAGEAALLVPAESPVALAESVLRLVEEDGLAEALRQRGEARLRERFSREAVVLGLAELYARLARVEVTS